MSSSGTSLDDDSRLAAIRRIRALTRLGDAELQRIVRLAVAVTGTRNGAIHILDDESQHPIARVGDVDMSGTSEDSMCRVVVEGGEAVAVADATTESMFEHSSHTQGASPIRAYAGSPLRDQEGNVLGTVCVFDTVPATFDGNQLELLADLATLVVNHLEAARFGALLADEASTDELTGLANRRALHDALDVALGTGAPVAVAFIDLDGFKAVNDTLGHDTGDAVLQEIAKNLVAAVRATDLVARYGGDELVVVASEGISAERLADAIAQPLVALEGGRLGGSIGLTTAVPGDTAQAILRRADALMYEEKAGSGRNR